MAEMIIPGTYITVRAEGLISAGGIATGVVGIVGTAASGPVGTPQTLAGFGNAREIFGLPDDFGRPDDGSHPLTLVRSLELLYGNGASTIIAVRVAGGSSSSATFAVPDADGHTVALLTAQSPGTWGNDIYVTVEEAKENCRIDNETYASDFDRLTYTRIVPSPDNRIRVFRGTTKRSETLDIIYKRVIEDETVRPDAQGRYILANKPIEQVAGVNAVRIVDGSGKEVRRYGDADIVYGAGSAPDAKEIRINDTTGELTFAASETPAAGQSVLATYAAGSAAPNPGQVLVTVWNGQLAFAGTQAPAAANGDTLTASYQVDRRNCRLVTLTHSPTVERYTITDGKLLAQRIGATSQLVSAAADASNGGNVPALTTGGYMGTGSNTPGSNGAEAGADDYGVGLEALANMLVNIVVLAGQDATTMGSVLLGHLNTTAETDYERIGVIGAKGGTLAEFLGHSMADGRVVLVAPGTANPDGTVLPPAYSAAAVAGLISSLPVQTSLTNKVLNVPGLALNFNRGQQEQLIGRNVLTLVNKSGFRVLKGVTTAGEGDPFAAIPTRRIVDYAKYGVRSAANPYIGRLNNTRVRAALKATLDAFLTGMVEDEALTGYELEVTATRAQEIAGEVNVTMTIQPTFSIDFIRVTMILK